MMTLPQGDEKVRAVRSMFDTIAPRYDLVNRIMTLRLDVRWRRRTVRRLALRPGSVVLDLACGTGDLCRDLQRGGLVALGLDLSHGMLSAARTTAPLVQADVLTLPVPTASVDGATCGFALRNLVGLEPFWAQLARVVRPGGRIAVLEVDEPANPLLRRGHSIYFGRVVPCIGALLSNAAAYRYLPRSVAYLPPPADLLAGLRAAGFVAVDRSPLSGGIAQLITATRGGRREAGSMKLRARHERLDTTVDLVALAGEDGVLFDHGRGFAGRGVALRIDVPRDPPATAAKAVHTALDAIAGAAPGRGPVALGALPFAAAVPGTLVVPEVLVGRDSDGARWVTTVLPADAGDADHDRLVESVVSLRDGSAAVRPEPERYEVRAAQSPARWQASVAAARDELRAGAGRKVVLARELVVEADRPLSRAAVARRLRRTYPACTVFAVEGFVGATPELLVARAGDIVRAQPMAGTAPRSADPTTDARLAGALLASAKDRAEHRFTIDMVHDTLLPYCSYLDEEAEPSIVAMANVQHLATQVEGRLSAPAASVVELMTALHPTPAVGGSPRDVALSLIGAHEPFDRGRYAGPVGWVDAEGNGEWVVGIRSAELSGRTARLFAGVGVVADSDPDAELAETRAKLEALLSALVVV